MSHLTKIIATGREAVTNVVQCREGTIVVGTAIRAITEWDRVSAIALEANESGLTVGVRVA